MSSWWRLLLLAALPACSLTAANDALARATPALISNRDFGWGQRPDITLDETLPRDKAAALARFGPPGEVLPLVDGDVFVYRWRLVQLDAINLHSGFVAPVALPLYGRLDGDQRDSSLMLAFDRDGQLRSWAIDDGVGVLLDSEPSEAHESEADA